MNDANYCTFYIIRHGQTEWNLKKIIQGHKDSPLTKIGIRIAKQHANKLKNIHFDAVFSSDSLRAKQTADIVALKRNIAINNSFKCQPKIYTYLKALIKIYQNSQNIYRQE